MRVWIGIFARAMRLSECVRWRRFDAFKGLSANSSAAAHTTLTRYKTHTRPGASAFNADLGSGMLLNNDAKITHTYGAGTELKRA